MTKIVYKVEYFRWTLYNKVEDWFCLREEDSMDKALDTVQYYKSPESHLKFSPREKLRITKVTQEVVWKEE